MFHAFQGESSIMDFSDGKKRVFDPTVLRSPSGEILSDGAPWSAVLIGWMVQGDVSETFGRLKTVQKSSACVAVVRRHGPKD